MKKLDFYTTAQESPWLSRFPFDILKRVDPIELQFRINRFTMNEQIRKNAQKS